MKILDRYIFRQAALFWVMLLLVLVGLAWMMQILSMLKILIQYNVGIWWFLELAMMMLPFIATLIAPFATFIAVMFIYNKMISDREATVMAGSGMSPARIARPALAVALCITALHFITSVWLSPLTQDRFYSKQWEMRYGLAHLALQESSFNTLTDNLVVFVDKVSNHDISQLMLFDNRNPKNQLVILAEKGKLVSTVRGMSIVMANGSVMSHGETLAVGTFDSYDMDMNISDKQIQNTFKVRMISTPRLISDALHPESLKKSDYGFLISELANRLVMPLMNLVLVLVALTVMLKMSLLRRTISMAAPLAVLSMAALMTAFMLAAGGIASLTSLGILMGGVLAAIMLLGFILIKK